MQLILSCTWFDDSFQIRLIYLSVHGPFIIKFDFSVGPTIAVTYEYLSLRLHVMLASIYFLFSASLFSCNGFIGLCLHNFLPRSKFVAKLNVDLFF